MPKETNHSMCYVVRHPDAGFFRSYAQGRLYDTFVPELNKAMLYAKEGTAKATATKMNKQFPSLKLVVVPVQLELKA